MGDRAYVIFVQEWQRGGWDCSPAIYLHWNGADVVDWLTECAPKLRQGDHAYAAATFVGFCFGKLKGSGMSLGITNVELPDCGDEDQELPSDDTMLNDYYEDRGVFIVDVDNGIVEQLSLRYTGGKRVKVAELTLGKF